MKAKILLAAFLFLFVLALVSGVYFGLHAEMKYNDPVVALNSITESGKLAVLTAEMNINNTLTMGPSSNPDYMKLYQQPGTAVYTVDLQAAEISTGVNSSGKPMIFIKLPEPQVDLYIDESHVENIDEYIKHGWSGTAEEGYEGYLRQTRLSYDSIMDSLQESDGLMLEAKESAISAVTELVEAAALDDVACEIYFYSTGRR